MEQQISERVSTLETDVAVIKSNYVRKDEIAVLREEVSAGFARTETQFAKVGTAFVQTDAKIDRVHAELDRKMDVGFAEVSAKVGIGLAEVSAKIDVGLARLDVKIERTTNTLLRWMFASQISVAAMFIAAIKYL